MDKTSVMTKEVVPVPEMALGRHIAGRLSAPADMEEKSAYDQGFLDKCAQLGADPGMVKDAIGIPKLPWSRLAAGGKTVGKFLGRHPFYTAGGVGLGAYGLMGGGSGAGGGPGEDIPFYPVRGGERSAPPMSDGYYGGGGQQSAAPGQGAPYADQAVSSADGGAVAMPGAKFSDSGNSPVRELQFQDFSGGQA